MSKEHHTHTQVGDVGRYVLMPGDPGRVPIIASYLDNAKHIATNREYVLMLMFVSCLLLVM